MKVTSLPGLPSLHSPWPKKDVLLASIRGTGRRSEFGSPPSHYILQARFCDSILWNKLRVFPLLRWCFYVKCTFLILSSLLLRWSFPQVDSKHKLLFGPYCPYLFMGRFPDHDWGIHWKIYLDIYLGENYPDRNDVIRFRLFFLIKMK